MDKMKGEAKVLLGKIEGRPEKVDAGKAIKKGETPTTQGQQGQEAST